MSLAAYLVLSGILFAIGAAIVLVRRSAVISLMGVELMLNSANLAFVTFARIHGNVSGEIMAFFVMVVAAAEVWQSLCPSSSHALPPTLTTSIF